jgi:excisionase family DNA binding protein
MHQSAVDAPRTHATADDGWVSKPIKEVAPLLGISVRLLWDYVRDGEIDSFRAGRRRLIRREAAEAWAKKREDEERALRAAVSAA